MKVKLVQIDATLGIYTLEPDNIFPQWKLSKENCDEIFGVVDVEVLAEKAIPLSEENIDYIEFAKHDRKRWVEGFNRALELNKDKLFTLRDIKQAIFNFANYDRKTISELDRRDMAIASIQQPTEIDVEVEMIEYGIGNDENGRSVFDTRPRLDNEGCLILKKCANTNGDTPKKNPEPLESKLLYFEYFLIRLYELEVPELTKLSSIKLLHYVTLESHNQCLLDIFDNIGLSTIGHHEKDIFNYMISKDELKYTRFDKPFYLQPKYDLKHCLSEIRKEVTDTNIITDIDIAIQNLLKRNKDLFNYSVFDLVKLNQQFYSYKIKSTDHEVFKKEDKWYHINQF
jgi:hypothetical protein